MVHVLLKPGLENFDHYFTSVWNECNCVVVWTFFGIVFHKYWNENWSFPSCGHCWVFQICWHIECSTFTASSFRIWNSLTGIPSPPLALLVVMLPKAYLTSHSRMSGSSWVITSSWLPGKSYWILIMPINLWIYYGCFHIPQQIFTETMWFCKVEDLYSLALSEDFADPYFNTDLGNFIYCYGLCM